MVEAPLGLITCSLEDSVTGTVLSPNGRTELLDGSAEEPGGGWDGRSVGSGVTDSMVTDRSAHKITVLFIHTNELDIAVRVTKLST